MKDKIGQEVVPGDLILMGQYGNSSVLKLGVFIKDNSEMCGSRLFARIQYMAPIIYYGKPRKTTTYAEFIKITDEQYYLIDKKEEVRIWENIQYIRKIKLKIK